MNRLYNSILSCFHGVQHGTIKDYGRIFVSWQSWKNYNEYNDRLIFPETNVKRTPIRIEEETWIEAYTIILKDVTIAIIGVASAGPVVTKSILTGEIWTGNSARFIKKIEGWNGD